ncbi:unnamed protein product [Calypogeia fissa]
MNSLRQVVLDGKRFNGSEIIVGSYGGPENGRNGISCRGKGAWRMTIEKTELRNLWRLSSAVQPGLRIGSRRPARGISASLGFTADPRVGVERAANGLLKDAAMLLLYQEVFRSPPAQAFLKVLLALRRGDDGLKLLEAYGEFFKLMAIGRYPSWEDYILEGILSGEKNPFAEASANVGNPRGVWSGGVPPSLRAAAAADLDSLQRLSITESTLSGWIAEMVADIRPEWRIAAASNFSSKSVPKTPTVSKEGANIFGFNTSEPRFKDVDDPEVNADHATSSAPSEEFVGKDLVGPGYNTKATHTFIHEDREMWRKKIGGHWRWSEAVPLLEKYYADHSVGRVASTQFLQWKGGKIANDPKWITKARSVCDLSVHQARKEALLKNLTRHAERRTAHHILLYGSSGTGKTWLLRSVLSEVTSSKGLHIITVPVSDLKSISTVLEELSRHWQLRFALIVDDLLSRGGEDNYAYLKSALEEWPDNVLLCATSPRKVAIPGRDGGADQRDIAHLFGLTLKVEDLDQDEYVSCVKELLQNRKSRLPFDSSIWSEDLAARANTWATKLDVWSVRSAAQFVNTLE